MSREAAFAALTALLRPYAEKLPVRTDGETELWLDEDRSTGKPQLFAAAQLRKSYAALHVYGVYVHPDLLLPRDPALLKRMQGKSCFNFKSEDQVLHEEIKALLADAYASLP